MENVVVSIIVPTRDSDTHLRRCLESVMRQTYPDIELIVVDNDSQDGTVEVAREYTSMVVRCGPERSAQVNEGVRKATGRWVFRVDSDFILDPKVVAECVECAKGGYRAVVVHNSPDVSVGLLSRVRKFETDMYKGRLEHSAARFVERDLFAEIGGYHPGLTAGEDYDFQNRILSAGVAVGFVSAEALHLGEPAGLAEALRKYYVYGADMRNFVRENPGSCRKQLDVVRPEYIANYRAFLREPLVGMLFVGYHLLKFAAGGVGYVVGTLRGCGGG